MGILVIAATSAASETCEREFSSEIRRPTLKAETIGSLLFLRDYHKL